jgi:hypothetical protein
MGHCFQGLEGSTGQAAQAAQAARRHWLSAATAASLLGWLAPAHVDVASSITPKTTTPAKLTGHLDAATLAQRLRSHLGDGPADALSARFLQRWQHLIQEDHLPAKLVLTLMHQDDLSQCRVLHVDSVHLSHTQVGLVLLAA